MDTTKNDGVRKRRFARMVLAIMASEGPDIHERMGRIVQAAEICSLGWTNNYATEDTDPWLSDLDGDRLMIADAQADAVDDEDVERT